MMDRRVSVNFRGRVQGVGFRFQVVDIARQYPITGYVKNEPDGTVSLVAEGSRMMLQAFLRAIRQSRLASNIHDCHESWYEAPDRQYNDFKVAF